VSDGGVQPGREPANDPYGVLKNRNFVLFILSRFLSNFAQQMLVVAVGWEVYERTNSTMALGFVGLAQMLPMFLLTFHAGHAADNYSRKQIVLWMQIALGITCTGMLVASGFKLNIIWTFVCLFALGAARTYLWPTSAAFMTQLVERRQFSKAVTWSTGSYQVSAVTGPAAGGALIALTHSAGWVYAFNVITAFVCAGLVSMIVTAVKTEAKEPMTWKSVREGLSFIYRTKIILGCMSLDMFAVLFGGATALLPVYAKDILHCGPNGLGWLQAALPLGSLLMSFIMLHRPPMKKAGPALLWNVVGFGLATIVFGYSTVFWLAFLSLFICGVTDYVSVVVRHTLVQLRTPDAMRGRVSAVNSLFIGTSNQLGEFESGLAASLTTPKFAVVSGGVVTIIVVIIASIQWPEIRKYGKLDA
jgi:MFS family permease